MRSPLAYGMNRGPSDDGGAADLQTDVMRFMAILSLCLVAIFALVQSIPQTAPPDAEAAATERPVPATAIPEPQDTAEVLASPVPQPVPVPEAVRLRPEDPPRRTAIVALPEPAAKATVEIPAEPVPPPPDGFTLSFESDDALSRLVARREIGFYAIVAGGKALRLNVDGGKASFWEASTPARYHEMDATTVPADVTAALRRSGIRSGREVVWAVTLPAAMTHDLDRYLRQYRGGALVIGSDGRLRREG